MGGWEDGRMGGWEEGRRGGCLQAERCAHRAEHILHLADLRLPEINRRCGGQVARLAVGAARL